LTGDVIVRPEAERDLNTAFTWYESQVVGLGEEFLLKIDAVFAVIRRHQWHSQSCTKTFDAPLFVAFRTAYSTSRKPSAPSFFQ
jgi:hypothetical protein